MKIWRTAAAALVMTTYAANMVSAAETETPSGEVYVFIAASLGNAMEEIKEGFEEQNPEVQILYNADSSGTLQVQIEEGARCDIFFSAARKQMDALAEKKLIVDGTDTDILENKVVLIKPSGQETEVTGFEDITKADNLALAGESVPVGQYAREIFENLDMIDEIEKMEINEGKNVSEVLAAVSEGSNEVGIVYQTDAASAKDSVEILAEAPKDSLETPVRYPAGMVNDPEASKEEQEAAKLFFKYLQSDEVQEIYEKYGFTVVEDETEDKEAAVS